VDEAAKLAAYVFRVKFKDDKSKLQNIPYVVFFIFVIIYFCKESSRNSLVKAVDFHPMEMRNEEIRRKTGLQKLELIIKESRLRWVGHVLRMEDSRIPRQAVQWELRGYKRKPGRPRKNWMDIIGRDLKDMDITWGDHLG